MSDHFDLGIRTRMLVVRLHAGAHFTSVLRLVDREWGADAAVELRFPDSFGAPTWAATLNGPVASWAVPADAADVVADAVRAELWVTAGGVSQVWAEGKAVRS